MHRDDLITLQNPHGIVEPTALTGAATAVVEAKKAEKDKVVVQKPVAETKKAVPCTCAFSSELAGTRDLLLGNISPYSTGAVGASLTSTSVDPHTQSSKLLWDEVKSFHWFQNLLC